jgi:hypothetical protein
MGRAVCRYEVFCDEGGAVDPRRMLREATEDEEIGELVGSRVHHRMASRDAEPDLFVPPPREVHGTVGGLRAPEAAGRDIADAIGRARACHVITVDEAQPADMNYLPCSLILSAALATERSGIVVDRTAGVGYGADVARLVAEDISVRDTVVVEEEPLPGGKVRLRTRGMSKFGEHDFVIDGVPEALVELARRLLYDNVCQYAAFQASIAPGQTLQYDEDHPEAELRFVPAGEGLLRIGDAEGEGAAPGIDRFLTGTEPAFRAQLAQEDLQEKLAVAQAIAEGQDRRLTIEAVSACLDVAPHHEWSLRTMAQALAAEAEAAPDDERRAASERRLFALADRIRPREEYSWIEWCNLAYLLNDVYAWPFHERGRELERALELSERSCLGVEFNLNHQGTRAAILMKLGRTEEAFELVRWIAAQLDGYAEAELGEIVSRADYRAWANERKGRPVVAPPGAVPPRTPTPAERFAGLDEPPPTEPSSPDERLSDWELATLLAVRTGADEWQRARNAVIVALLLEAPFELEDLLDLLFTETNLSAGTAEIGGETIELEEETVAKLRHWFHLHLAHPGHRAREGDKNVFSRTDLEPMEEEDVERVLAEVGAAAGVRDLSRARIATHFEVLQRMEVLPLAGDEQDYLQTLLVRARQMLGGPSDPVAALQAHLDRPGAGRAAGGDVDVEGCTALGAYLGDILSRRFDFEWVAVEDADGRTPALRDKEGRGFLLFPLTMIVKRVVEDEPFSVAGMCEAIQNALDQEEEEADEDDDGGGFFDEDDEGDEDDDES